MRLGGYLADWDGGPDQLLFRAKLDREAARTGHANRMAPNTAAALLLVGLALLLLDVRVRRGLWPAQFLALAAAVIALLAVVGYAYSAVALAGVEQFIPMALNTGRGASPCSAPASCAPGPTDGLMAVVTSAGAGGVMARRLLPGGRPHPGGRRLVRWLGQQEGWSTR